MACMPFNNGAVFTGESVCNGFFEHQLKHRLNGAYDSLLLYNPPPITSLLKGVQR
jgi:hypothetical protein